MFTKLQGLIAAPHTPFDKGGEVNYGEIDHQIAWLVESGVRGAYICGTTGEGLSLTTRERQLIAERWVDVAGGKLDIIVHVGHHSIGDAILLASHADGLDIHSISAIAPTFFKPCSVDELIRYFKPITTASKRPFYYYHSPGMTGVNLPLDEFLTKAPGHITNLAGVKFNSGDLFEYQKAIAIEDGRFDIPFGSDESLLGALAVGSTSAIGSTYNYVAPLYLALWEAFDAGDMNLARAYSAKAVAMIKILVEYGVMASGKAIMQQRGVRCGDPRLPISPLAENSRLEMLEKLDRLGVLEIKSVNIINT